MICQWRVEAWSYREARLIMLCCERNEGIRTHSPIESCGSGRYIRGTCTRGTDHTECDDTIQALVILGGEVPILHTYQSGKTYVGLTLVLTRAAFSFATPLDSLSSFTSMLLIIYIARG